MTEFTFTKSFLLSLDSQSVKLPSDHVFDPSSFETPHPVRKTNPAIECLRSDCPQYTLTRLSDRHPPMPRKIKQPTIPGSSKSIRIHLKSARNPALHITLDNCSIPSTSVGELKEVVQERVQVGNARVPLDRIKILWKRKPVQGETIAEILEGDSTVISDGSEIELGVMILGGASLISATPSAGERKHSEKSSETLSTQDLVENDARNVLATEEFWDDLESFVKTKVKDAVWASQIRSVFRKAWVSSR
ncbi:hypothetical protein I7I51_01172 [Histoplasma capsulatum]|uniref:Ubiquitin-like domain-containing protein n=1 Tax=Ajellomyces capsulatus TaxID=5037 RepID=A0A8A1MG37_AJECA|nr:hypothetical protein I7I51_01172 [Histoplasma capsulatum]